MTAKHIRQIKAQIRSASGLRKLELTLRLEAACRTMAAREYRAKRLALVN